MNSGPTPELAVPSVLANSHAKTDLSISLLYRATLSTMSLQAILQFRLARHSEC